MTFRNESHAGVRQIIIDNFGGGSISIDDGPGGSVETSLNAADEEFLASVQIRQDHDQLRFSFPSPFFRSTPAHLRLGVPPGLGFTIRAGAADVAITAEIGQSKITSGSGDVTVGRVSDLDCTSGSGSISVARLAGRSGRIASGSGDITIAEAHCPLTAKTASGEVVIRELHGTSLQANSASGDIAVNWTSGSVGLRSASGSLTVGIAGDLPAWLDLTSVSGEVRIALESAAPPAKGDPFVAVRARTASGDIAVYRA